MRGHSKQQAREYVFRNGVSAPCRGRDLYALQMDDQGLHLSLTSGVSFFSDVDQHLIRGTLVLCLFG